MYAPIRPPLDSGLVTVDVTRRRRDGSVVERKRGLYMLRRDGDRWKIVVVVDTPLSGLRENVGDGHTAIQ